MQIIINNIITEDITTDKLTTILQDYSYLLIENGVTYHPSEYYWQVGDIKKKQGWMLHLSVIQPQLNELLIQVIPELIASGVSFKIVRDTATAIYLLQGNLGYINLGKLVCVYPEDDSEAVELGKKLIMLTKLFKGPAIPTDIHLGAIVYTRYGSFNPVKIMVENGNEIKCIRNSKGQLISDADAIPFIKPQGINWPFDSIAKLDPKQVNKLLNHRYYPLSNIKSDAKGNVIKAIYFKHFWQIKTCLVKQGRQYMLADAAGRDIQDKLKWQYQLNKELV